MKNEKDIQPGDRVQLENGGWAKAKTNTNGMISDHRMLMLDIQQPDWVHVPHGN